MIKEKVKALSEIFPEEMKRVETVQAIDQSSFRDHFSKKEFQISGMCQKCQDEMFADPEENEYGDSEIEEMKQEQNQKYFEADYQGGDVNETK